jgi:DNA topoisomerase-2
MDLLQYVKRDEHEHVLLNPDTYVGSVENVETNHLVFKDGRIQFEDVKYNPALLKLFDEIAVNAADHSIRTKTSENPVTHIQFSIDKDTISVTNNGEGIDVALHPEHKIYIPQLIFATLRTSRNFNVDEKRIVGGKNGFGVKLVFIWSTYASVECVDSKRQLIYTQTFENNLKTIHEPVIKPCKKKSYTKITFKPDYARLKLSGLDPQMLSLLERRIYDIASVTDKSVKVSYNDKLVETKNLVQYVDLFVGSKTETPRSHFSCDRWEIIVCKSLHEEFTAVSYVNGIHTNKGGTHVQYILNQIIRKLIQYIKDKKKVDVKSTTIKEHLMLFIQCSIENPSFDSQTKDYLNTPSSSFGSSCEIPEKCIEDIAKKVGIMEIVLSITKSKELVAAKKSDGSKTRKITGIPKLIDANFAGTSKSKQTTLILCEGDSARSAILSGLSSEDRNTYGIYPLRGKLLNVRDESITTVSNNKEIKELMTILGLKFGKEYTTETVNELRYGHVLFMTDQDLDGSHIKALCINVIGCLWPSLLKLGEFIGFMNTPIIKITKGTVERNFYNEEQYLEWKQQEKDPKKWNIKYFKGLGTSTSVQFKQYFKDKKIVHFVHTEQCDQQLDMIFNKKRANDRKHWLEQYIPQTLNTDVLHISFTDLINKEVIKFSKYDCDRSIPNGVDGFKISQRKILFCGLMKPIVHEIKVAQFSGYVSEKSSYHHGEASLNGAIINMAQDYVGSNNINLFKPNGQFGTRLQGGKDHASERYIFTQLHACTRYIFRKEDDDVLTYLDDDGTMIEPAYYCPIIPMILVNGCNGIGTGFSSKIPCYNPKDIIRYLREYIGQGSSSISLTPYYRGFKGTIEETDGKHLIRGVYSVKDLHVTITELPIGMWTDTYKQFLEESIGTLVKDYTDKSTDINIHIVVTLLQPSTNIESDLKLTSSISTSNMHLNTSKNQLKKYTNVYDIIADYSMVRLEMYTKRKVYLIQVLDEKLKELSNRVHYIRLVLKGTIDLRNKKIAEINDLLQQLKLEKQNDSYSYLIKMPMDSVSSEHVEQIERDLSKLTSDKTILINSTEKQMWLHELDELYTKL